MAYYIVPPTAGCEAVRFSLCICDGETQAATSRIVALADAATRLLSMDLQSLLTVRVLLDDIGNAAADLQATIEEQAEKHGCSFEDFRDERARVTVDRLWQEAASQPQRAA